MLNGHLSPGGGFSGGAIMGAGLMIYVTAFGFKDIRRFFTYKTYQRRALLAAHLRGQQVLFVLYRRERHPQHHPLGTPGAILSSGLILVLNICVGFYRHLHDVRLLRRVPERRGVRMLDKYSSTTSETVSVILFCIGFSTMLLNKNLIKKIIGMDIMDTAVYPLPHLAGLPSRGARCRLWWTGFNPSRRISTRFRPAWC